MSKSRPSRPAPRRPRVQRLDPVAAQRKTLRRARADLRAVAALARQVERARERADAAVLGLLRRVALDGGMVVEDAAIVRERIERLEAADAENARLRAELYSVTNGAAAPVA